MRLAASPTLQCCASAAGIGAGFGFGFWGDTDRQHLEGGRSRVACDMQSAAPHVLSVMGAAKPAGVCVAAALRKTASLHLRPPERRLGVVHRHHGGLVPRRRIPGAVVTLHGLSAEPPGRVPSVPAKPRGGAAGLAGPSITHGARHGEPLFVPGVRGRLRVRHGCSLTQPYTDARCGARDGGYPPKGETCH